MKRKILLSTLPALYIYILCGQQSISLKIS